jgi:hypothetical protein
LFIVYSSGVSCRCERKICGMICDNYPLST